MILSQSAGSALFAFSLFGGVFSGDRCLATVSGLCSRCSLVFV